MIKLGNTDINKVYLGSNEINKAYLGNQVIFDKTAVNPFADAALAFSLRDLGLGATNVVRVRRDSDNTEQDFTATQITDGSLLSFVGSGNGFVSIWYDQSNNQYNATQTTASQQPTIVENGTLVLTNNKPAIKWVNIENRYHLVTPIFSTIPQPVTRIAVASGNRYIIDGNSRGFFRVLLKVAIFSGNILEYDIDFENQQNIFYAEYNSNNSQLTVNNNDLGFGDAGTQGLNNIHFGGHNLDASPGDTRYAGTMQEIIAFGKLTDKQSINTEINNYYAIY